MTSDTKKQIFYGAVFSLPPLLVVAYAGLLLWITSPVQELTIAKSEVFGDSFGMLKALFSSLVFAGVIVTILIQKDEWCCKEETTRAQRATSHPAGGPVPLRLARDRC